MRHPLYRGLLIPTAVNYPHTPPRTCTLHAHQLKFSQGNYRDRTRSVPDSGQSWTGGCFFRKKLFNNANFSLIIPRFLNTNLVNLIYVPLYVYTGSDAFHTRPSRSNINHPLKQILFNDRKSVKNKQSGAKRPAIR